MLRQILIGSLLVSITTIVHALCTLAALRVLHLMRADNRAPKSHSTRVGLIVALVLMLFLAALLEAGVWAAAYVEVGAIAEPESALYFSTVTYTTLGYGDVVLGEEWRLLGSLQAANGVMMFGWTTALVVAFVHRLAERVGVFAEPRA